MALTFVYIHNAQANDLTRLTIRMLFSTAYRVGVPGWWLMKLYSVVPVRSKGLWSQALSKLAIPESPPSIPQESGIAGSNGAAGAAGRDLVPRRMQDSYCEILLPFASNPELLENYTNASGGIRTGLLLENLDSLAGSIAYKHQLGPDTQALPKDAGFYIVTASVERLVVSAGGVSAVLLSNGLRDRLDMLASLYPVRDMRLSGQVIHTGKSSMEVAVRMEALAQDGSEQTIMLGASTTPSRHTYHPEASH